jgi:hypothetical protein
MQTEVYPWYGLAQSEDRLSFSQPTGAGSTGAAGVEGWRGQGPAMLCITGDTRADVGLLQKRAVCLGL